MERLYRASMRPHDLATSRVVVGETDLWLASSGDQSHLVGARVRFYRRQLRAYMERDPMFEHSLEPLQVLPGAPPLVRAMLAAGAAAGVGPMAAVAGAISQAVADDLRDRSPELILENGGDLYLRSAEARTVALLAGGSDFSGRIGLDLPPCPGGMGVCTSSGTTGPSFSRGKADAAVVVAPDAALADAAATALGNRIQFRTDLETAVRWAADIPGVVGALAILGDGLAAAGDLRLVPLEA